MRNGWPLVVLAGITPCVEFLTGSTSFIQVVTDAHGAGLVFVLLTLPGYIFPVWLIREALVVWKKGIASLLALGIAYGAVNEGLLAKTYFVVNPLSPSLGPGGGVGHWLGVNWPWVTGITLFHMVVSISVPVALCFLIFPRTRTTRFLGARPIQLLLVYLFAEIVGLLTIQSLFSPTFRDLLPLLLIPSAIVVAGVVLARMLRSPHPQRQLVGVVARPLVLALASFGFFVITFLPILQLFPIPFVPAILLIRAFDRIAGPYGIIVTIYPLLLAGLAIRFFTHYTVTNTQLLAMVAGAMLLPIVGAIALLSFAQGATVAAGIYIGAITWAWNRSRKANDPMLPTAFPGSTDPVASDPSNV